VSFVSADGYIHVDLREAVAKPAYKLDGIFVDLDQLNLPEDPLPNMLSECQGGISYEVIYPGEGPLMNGFRTDRATNDSVEWYYLTPIYKSDIEPLRRQQEIQARMSYISLVLCARFGARYLVMRHGPKSGLSGYNLAEIADLTSWYRAMQEKIYEPGYFFAWRAIERDMTPFDSSFLFKNKFDYTRLVSIEIIAYKKKYSKRIP